MSALKLKKIPSLSNKSKTPGLSSGHSVVHPSPFIDRISVVLKPPDEVAATTLHKDVYKLFDEPDFFVKTKGGLYHPYKVARRVPLPSLVDHKKWPLFQYAFHEGKAHAVRIEFVPVDLGAIGLKELHSVLITFLPDGWGTFIHLGKITRLDVAVDFPTKTVSDFLFLPKQGATVTTWKSNGALETFQSGKPSGDYTQIYNRKAKRIAQGKSSQGKEGIRVERRLGKVGVDRIEDLPLLPNPFLKLSLVEAIDTPPAGSKEWVWRLWLNAVDRLGLMPALSILPEDMRTSFRSHYAKGAVSWWSPTGIWEHWVPMLNELGIGDPKQYP